MTVSRQPQITEELLSAYLDEQVTAEERALVEAAIATDPAIAWQVDSLRQTVQMLQALPPLTLPRTFTLEALLVEARAAEATAPLQPEVVIPTNRTPQRTVGRTPVTEEPATPWWQWFLQLWQGGNLQLRNAAAVAFTLFFVLIAGDRFLVSTRPLVEELPAAAPIVVTSEPVVLASEGRLAVEVPVAPAAAEPTVTSAPADVAVTTAANSNDQTAVTAIESAVGANTVANPAAQPENNVRQPEGATFAAPGGAPGPVEETLNPEGGASADASTARTFGAPAGGERDIVAKSTTPMADAVAANAAVMQGYAITGETQLTTTLAAPMSGTVTTTAMISVTPTMTPTVVITSTVLPTVTMAKTTPLTTATPTVDEGSAWLSWAQMITALSTLVLAGLWWRSRR
jgi:anti-sigma factor RsiW